MKLRCLVPKLLQGQARGPGWAPDEQRGNRHARGYGWELEKLRKRILARDFGLCVPCRSEGIVTAATQVDHIVQKADEGNDDPNNLQSICEACHKTKTARESQGY